MELFERQLLEVHPDFHPTIKKDINQSVEIPIKTWSNFEFLILVFSSTSSPIEYIARVIDQYYILTENVPLIYFSLSVVKIQLLITFITYATV